MYKYVMPIIITRLIPGSKRLLISQTHLRNKTSISGNEHSLLRHATVLLRAYENSELLKYQIVVIEAYSIEKIFCVLCSNVFQVNERSQLRNVEYRKL